MKAVIQRVNYAQVTVAQTIVGKISRPGIFVLVGITHTDGEKEVAALAKKIARLRVLEGEKSIVETNSPVLVVSQFTLYADVRKGRRPSWHEAAPGQIAQPLFESLVQELRNYNLEVETGKFGAHMKIDMQADGPVTIVIEV